MPTGTVRDFAGRGVRREDVQAWELEQRWLATGEALAKEAAVVVEREVEVRAVDGDGIPGEDSPFGEAQRGSIRVPNWV